MIIEDDKFALLFIHFLLCYFYCLCYGEKRGAEKVCLENHATSPKGDFVEVFIRLGRLSKFCSMLAMGMMKGAMTRHWRLFIRRVEMN